MLLHKHKNYQSSDRFYLAFNPQIALVVFDSIFELLDRKKCRKQTIVLKRIKFCLTSSYSLCSREDTRPYRRVQTAFQGILETLRHHQYIRVQKDS